MPDLIRPLFLALIAGCAAGQQFQFMADQSRRPTSFLPTTTAGAPQFAVGDLDGDGRADVVLVDGSVSIFRATPTGYAAIGVPVAIGNSRRPALLDIDGDGDLDLVLGPTQPTAARTVACFEWTGAGFQARALPAPLATRNVAGAAMGDIDGDGDADLVVGSVAGSGASRAIEVHRNGGGFAFTADAAASPATGVGFGASPGLGDVDGDGDLDVLASNPAGTFEYLQNQGGGVFARGALPPTRIGHVASRVGDFDGDGRADLVAIWWNGDVDVLWSNGTGFTFQTALTSGETNAIEPADLDGDGDLDLVVVQSQRVQLLRNLGGRSFDLRVVADLAIAGAGTGDVDGDGNDDLLFRTPDSLLVRCWFRCSPALEDTAWQTGFAPAPAVGVARHLPVAGDVDGDGRIDVLLPNQAGLVVQHALGDGRYRATQSAPAALTNQPYYHRLADLDGDGDLDLLLESRGALAVLRNNGAGAFTPAGLFGGSGGGFDSMRTCDLDGDGDVDVVRADSGGVWFHGNDGTGALTTNVLLVARPPAQTLISALDVFDADGDGDLDVLTTVASGTGSALLIQNAMTFQVVTVPLPSNVVASIAHGDFDGDGDQDVASNGSPVLLLDNLGGGTFVDVSASRLPPPGSIGGGGIAAGDLDGDGDVDLALVAGAPTKALLLVNTGNGSFLDVTSARLQPIPGTSRLLQIALADLDDDGDPDLLLGAHDEVVLGFPLTGDQLILRNHARQCVSTAVPRVGGSLVIDSYTGPGLGLQSLSALLVSPGGIAPLPLPGIGGGLMLDPAVLGVAVLTGSGTGLSRAILPIPPRPSLVATQWHFQQLLLPPVGAAGFSNSVAETILP